MKIFCSDERRQTSYLWSLGGEGGERERAGGRKAKASARTNEREKDAKAPQRSRRRQPDRRESGAHSKRVFPLHPDCRRSPLLNSLSPTSVSKQGRVSRLSNMELLSPSSIKLRILGRTNGAHNLCRHLQMNEWVSSESGENEPTLGTCPLRPEGERGDCQVIITQLLSYVLTVSVSRSTVVGDGTYLFHTLLQICGFRTLLSAESCPLLSLLSHQ